MFPLTSEQQAKTKFHLGYNLATPAADHARIFRAMTQIPDEWTSGRVGDLIVACDGAYELTSLEAGTPATDLATSIEGDLDRTTSLLARDPYNRRLRAYVNQCNFLATTLGVRNYRDPEQAGVGLLLDGGMFINTLPGVKGDPGGIGETGPPGAGTSPRGAWDNSTTYALYDLVQYLGSAWVANTGNTNKTPGVDPEWDLLVAKGEPGNDGADGATGSVTAASGLTFTEDTEPATPSSNNLILYVDSADGLLKQKNDAGVVNTIGGGANTFADNVFRIQDNADATKQIAFEVSGIATGTTRTFTLPDSDGTIALTSNLSGYALKSPEINAQTGTSYSLVLEDAGKIVTMNNASANTLNIPTNASVAFPTGTVIEVWRLNAATTIDAGTGVTLNGVSAGNTTLSAAYAPATLRKIGTDTWLVATGGAASVA